MKRVAEYIVLLIFLATVGLTQSHGQIATDSVNLSLSDSIKHKYNISTDFLHPKNPADTLLLDSISNPKLTKTRFEVDTLKQEIDSLSNNTDLPENEFTHKINDRVEDNGDMPTIESPEALDPSLPPAEFDKNNSLPSVNGNPVEKIDELKDDAGVNDVTEKFQEVKDVPKEKIESVKSIDEIEKVTDGVSDIKSAQEEVNTYNEEVKAVKEGDYSKMEQRAEEEASKHVDELNEVSSNAGEMEALKREQEEKLAQLEMLKEKKEVKNQLKQRAAERGAKFFAKYQDQLQKAQNPYGKYKRKFLKAKDEKKKWLSFRSNSMKEKGFLERTLFGFYTQYIKMNTHAIDLSPIVGYHLSGIFVLGGGGTYRLDLGSEGMEPKTSRTYGYKFFVDAKAYKGFYLHGEFESMRTDVPQNNISDLTKRDWVNSMLLGIGKKYKIKNRVNGYVQGLYNINYQNNRTPYPKSLMLRIGVEGVFGGRKGKEKVE